MDTTEVSRSEYTMVYVDGSPSELFHSLSDKIIILTMVQFFHIDLPNIEVNQFKDTRRQRKLAMQDYIIDKIEKGQIEVCGTVVWNYQNLALENAKAFLIHEKLLTSADLEKDKVEFAGESISIGKLLSLTWYSFVLATRAIEVSSYMKIEGKEKAVILLDLIAGDTFEYSNNLKIVRYIINNSEQLKGMFDDVLRTSKKAIGTGYAMKHDGTGSLKYSPPFSITDWITNSFFNKIRSEKIMPDENYERYLHLSKLANYLVEKGTFLIAPPVRFIE